jgi:hypothetical protein
VDLQDLELVFKLDAYIRQNRHKALAKGFELLLRVPDLANSEVSFGTEADVESIPSGGILIPAASSRRILSSYFSAVRALDTARTTKLMARSLLVEELKGWATSAEPPRLGHVGSSPGACGFQASLSSTASSRHRTMTGGRASRDSLRTSFTAVQGSPVRPREAR